MNRVSKLPVVIHPGFVKTATTTLQRNLFAQHSEVHYLGWPAPNAQISAAINAILYEDSETYEEERISHPIREFCLSAAQPKRITVFSHENCSLYEATDRGVIAGRLAALFPDARVLFTIRRQQDLLAGWYLQKLRKYLKGNHYLTFEEWLKIKQREPHKSIIANLDYSKTILNYARLFGRENVLVLPFELLRDDVGAFSAAIAGWLQIEPKETERLMRLDVQNPATTTAYAAFYRNFRRFLPRWLAKKIGDEMIAGMGLGEKLELRLDTVTETLVKDLCAQGNLRLEQVFGLDLHKYNYLVADAVATAPQ